MNPDSQLYKVLEIIAVSGEINSWSIHYLNNNKKYSEKILTELNHNNYIKVHCRDNLKGYRLSLKSKKILLSKNYERFKYVLQGDAETNRVKSEFARRLRLQRMSELYVLLYKSNIEFFNDKKIRLFDDSFSQNFTAYCENSFFETPTFYTSIEMKNTDGSLKINNSRSMGVLLCRNNIYLIYNTSENMLKWSSSAELRTKIVIEKYIKEICQLNQYRNVSVSLIIFASEINLAYDYLTNTAKNLFRIDGSFEHVYFLSLDRKGEALLKLLTCESLKQSLDELLMTDLKPRNENMQFIHNALLNNKPVLFAYTLNLFEIAKFNKALEIHNLEGNIICFDFQKKVIRKYCSDKIGITTINFDKFERSFLCYE